MSATWRVTTAGFLSAACHVNACAFGCRYVQRAKASMPKQGTESPWKLKHNYIYDSVHLGLLTIEDGVLNFTAEGEAVGPSGAAAVVEAARL